MIKWPGLDAYTVRDVHTLCVPTYVNVSKKLTKALNLNEYRNMHYHHLNEQKKNFHSEVKSQLEALPRMDKIAVHYEIFAPRNNRLDTMNVGSVTDKYFSDSMVEAERILDDNYHHIVASSFSFGGVDKMNGHAKITIFELEEETPMRVLLDDNDFQTALENYVEQQGIAGATGVKITVQGDKVEAEVLFGDAPAVVAEKAPAKKGRGGRPAGSKNKPKVEETADDSQHPEADSSGSDTGASEPATKASEITEEAGKTSNPFAEGGTESSDSATPTKDEGQADEPTSKPEAEVKPKKKSIFDVD